MRIGLLQRVDLLQVFLDGDVERWLFDALAGGFEAGHSEFAAFEFMTLAPLRLKRLGCCYPRAGTAPRAAHVPLNVVSAVRKSIPVVVAFGISGNGKHLPL